MPETVKILYDNLWPTITRLAKKAKRKHVAVAYLGTGATRLLPLRKDDVLVIDMSTDAVKSGQTNPYEAEKYVKKGVKVYTCSNLHAKIYVFDATLLIGSANVSQHSKNNLIEAGLMCRDKAVLTQALGLIRSLQAEPATPKYIELCRKLYEPPRPWRDTKKKRKHFPTPLHSRLWLLSISPVDLSEEEEALCHDGEERASKKIKDTRKFDLSSIRWTGKSGISRCIKEGDLVVQIWNDKKKRKVYPPSRVVQLTHFQSFDERKSPMMFIHIEEPSHPSLMSWPAFKEKVEKAGVGNIGRNPQREIRSVQAVHTILGLWS